MSHFKTVYKMGLREKIFDKFSQNFEYVKQLYGITIKPENNSNIYICPITLNIYTKETLLNHFDDELTIEHVPPKSLGGKPIALTSKKENNRSGHTLDYKIGKLLQLHEFIAGNSTLPLTLRVNDSFNISADLINSDPLRFEIRSKRRHFGVDKIFNLISSQDKFNIQIQ